MLELLFGCHKKLYANNVFNIINCMIRCFNPGVSGKLQDTVGMGEEKVVYDGRFNFRI